MSRFLASFAARISVGESKRSREHAAKLKDRTLTKLYNARPAYGWPATLTNNDLPAKLPALNLARAGTTVSPVDEE